MPTAYLAGYPPNLTEPVARLLEQGRLGEALRKKYPEAHAVRTDRALYDYVQDLRGEFLRNAPQPSKIVFDGKLQSVGRALGTHTRVARVQGGKLKTKHEIRIAAVFREAPPEFLRMIVAHELAHLKESEHDKAFYQLCRRIEPDYHQLEFDLRVYLCHLATGGEGLWPAMSGLRHPA
ncbi:YgjP-like metallopeptidase domain-containing protein [uncultured Azonexus sp.]|uniref:YgjP-like metallopeptidase domain-containing protein n=1 Tax=uncultured Azonexus sp. TaxID=520307 RepID=UPI00261449D5|nr:YgjP-like metallopeptidase domain-containing protein [uncultured Azonexus sp.]